MVVPAEAQALLTRGDLRWRIANRLGGSEEWAWRALASDGGTQHAVLPDLVIGGLNEQRGLWAWFSDGPNAGLERRVIAFAPFEPGDPAALPDPVPDSQPQIEWSPPLPAAVVAGDRVWLSVLRPTRINDAIDDALRLMAEPTALPAEMVLVTDGLSDTLALPADAVAVADVAWLGESDLVVDGVADETRSLLSRSSWEMVPGRGVRVGNVGTWGPLGWAVSVPPAGWRLHVDYRAAVPLPLTDDDIVACLPQAVVSSAVADLAMGLAELRPLLPLLLDQAQRDRSRAGRHDAGAIRPVIP